MIIRNTWARRGLHILTMGALCGAGFMLGAHTAPAAEGPTVASSTTADDLGPGEITPPDGYGLACDAGYIANDTLTGCQPIDPTMPEGATVYEDGSWTAGDLAGCIPGALCDD